MSTNMTTKNIYSILDDTEENDSKVDNYWIPFTIDQKVWIVRYSSLRMASVLHNMADCLISEYKDINWTSGKISDYKENFIRLNRDPEEFDKIIKYVRGGDILNYPEISIEDLAYYGIDVQKHIIRKKLVVQNDYYGVKSYVLFNTCAYCSDYEESEICRVPHTNMRHIKYDGKWCQYCLSANVDGGCQVFDVDVKKLSSISGQSFSRMDEYIDD